MNLPSAPAATPVPTHMSGVFVERYVTRPGPVALAAVPSHRIKVHTGASVTGTCGHSRFAYSHGDVDLLPAGSSDTWVEDCSSTSVLVHVPPSLLARTADELGLDGARVGLAPQHQFRDPRIEHIAWALDADREAGSTAGPLYAESLATALLVHLVARHRAPHVSLHGLSRPQLRRVTEYIEAHLDQDLSLARLAQIVGISASHLKTQFKRSMGVPVHAYVVRRRVDYARTRLMRRDLPASQVALEAGFAHQSHMVRCLRRVLGDAALPLLRRAR